MIVGCSRILGRWWAREKAIQTACLSRYSTSGKDGEISDTSANDEIKVKRAVEEFVSPWYILKQEIANSFTKDTSVVPPELPVPRETDILVMGGGVIGSSVAYWMKQRHPKGYNLCVIEKDPSYQRAATVLSVGGLRQQFSLPENIEMSLFTADFIRDIKEHLSIYGVDPPDVQFCPQGYLFLASKEGEETLHANHKIQTELGAKVKMMNVTELREKFPWLNTEGITYGSYGLQNEGYFDPWLLLSAFRNKATSLGSVYVKGEIVGFDKEEYKVSTSMGIMKRHRIIAALVKHEDGNIYPIKFAAGILCGGPWSGEIAALAGIGAGDGMLGVPLPVEPRKRYVYVVHCPDGPGLEMPFLIDPSGVYIRREGIHGHYLCGASPPPEGEPSTGDLTVDYEFFNEVIWPKVAQRGSCFECLKLKSAWAGYYDYNYYDQNLVIGNHPYHRNIMFATGCSGHGIQQAPAIGRAMMEFILDDGFVSIDLKRFAFDRILDNEPIFESNIV